jgi:membrane-bound lytic murein transglycosylase B
VRLPADFDYALANAPGKRALAEWRALGITDAFGKPLPALDLPARLLVPAGHRGPAFVTYRNFDVIMGWNRSEFYALAVGRLADRIAGAGQLSAEPPDRDLRMARDDVLQLQQDLNGLGFDAGEPDGIPGPATRAALGRFQLANGLIADGYVNQAAIDAVRAAALRAGTDA